jgi:predicted TPR repeat methyltransferase
MHISEKKNIETRFSRACDLHSRSEFSAAEKIYLRLLEQMPDAGLVHYNIGLLYYQTKRYNRAINHYTLAKKSAPADPDLLFNLALCQKKIGRVEDAAKSFQQLIQLEPKEPDSLYNLANCYRELRKYDQAEDAYLRALAEQPDHLSANRNLAYLYHLRGDFENGLKYYNRVLDIDPGDHQAAYMAAAIRGGTVSTAPAPYVRDIFNRYSESFDKALLIDLKYSVPDKLKRRFDMLDHPLRFFSKGIDLGCGTGLAGEQFRPLCNHLTGVDLSEKMIEKAAAKRIYDILSVSEITAFLATKENEYDLVVAADVLTYVGDLHTLFSVLDRATTDQALFCCSAENSCSSTFSLCTNGRFVHSNDYVLQTANRYGWRSVDLVPTDLRREKSTPVKGTLYFFEKEPDASAEK